MSDRVVALLASPELLLRGPDLGGIRAGRDRVAMGLAGVAVPGHSALLAVQGDGDPGHRSPGASHARRGVSTLSADDERVCALEGTERPALGGPCRLTV